MSFEEGLDQFRALTREVKQGALVSPRSTESDTRAKVITRVLTRCLGWTEEQITREEHSNAGYLDYSLRNPRKVLVVEAKRVGTTFVFPAEKSQRKYRLKTLIGMHDKVGKCVRQCRDYCDAQGIEYGCVTNGYQWIVFRALSQQGPWSAGDAVVFRSLEDIEKHFLDFWNLLAAEPVKHGSLISTFTVAAQTSRAFARAIDGIGWADNAQSRNRLSAQLQPLIDTLFRDIIGEGDDDILKRCYVADRRARGVVEEVEDMFLDTLPKFAVDAGFEDLDESTERSGALDPTFRRAVLKGDFGQTALLLGGVGCGKTTFIHRFLRVTAKEFVDEHCTWFYVPFTDAPNSAERFTSFTRERILQELGDRYAEIDVESAAALRAIYSDHLARKRRGLWSELDESERKRREVDYLESLTEREEHCDAVLRYLRLTGRAVALVLDNVDQRTPEEQVSVFLMAHDLSRRLDAIVFVALREESFFRANQTGAFNAYHNIRYHIASPDVKKILRARVTFSVEVASQGQEALQALTRSGVAFDSDELAAFLKIVERTVLKGGTDIGRFIDAVAQGDTRAALDMFNQFVVSGWTYVDKMLNAGRGYTVAEHEFIKSVMLGDRQFYRDATSRVMNVFEVAAVPTASNLTALRILDYLKRRSGRAHAEGAGFVSIIELVQSWEEVFGETRDCVFQLERLARHKLVEFENRQLDSATKAKFVRSTTGGRYYLEHLSRKFVYLDVVCVDTPIADEKVASRIRKLHDASDLLDRIERTEWLLQYLRHEERHSLASVPRDAAERLFSVRLGPAMIRSYDADVRRICRSAPLSPAGVEKRREAVRAEAAKLGLG